MKKRAYRYGGIHREPQVIKTGAYLLREGFIQVDGRLVMEDASEENGGTRKRTIIYEPLEGAEGYYRLVRDYTEISKP